MPSGTASVRDATGCSQRSAPRRVYQLCADRVPAVNQPGGPFVSHWVAKTLDVSVVQVSYGPVDPVPAGLSWSIDGPSPESVHSSWVYCYGWVVPPEGHGRVARVTVEAESGEVLAELVLGQPRPDVEAALAPRPAAGCGFSGDVNIDTELGFVDQLVVRAFWDGGSAVIARVRLESTTSIPTRALDHSQLGEVSLIAALITPDFPTSVVDVGAHDGWTLSNSYPFIASGWSGVLVEPLPSVFAVLVANHRRHRTALCLNVACSDHDGTASFFIGRDGDLGMNSTLSTDDNEWMRSTRSDRSIEVPVRRLSSLLSEAGVSGDIGILLIDCEGMDLEALSGLDPAMHRPWVVVTEMYASNPAKEDAKHALLSSWGLVHHVDTGVNEIWCQPFLVEPG